MLRPVFLPHLDEAIERGCQPPNCPHDHGSAIFLTSRCHPGGGVRIENLDELPGIPCAAVVGLRCWRCPRLVVQVALITRLELTPACRHGSALDGMYKQNPQSARQNNFSGEQIARWFLLLSEHRFGSNYSDVACIVRSGTHHTIKRDQLNYLCGLVHGAQKFWYFPW